MKTKANEFGASVFMGFNKNVSKYVSKTRAYAESHPGTNVTFLHNNNYCESGLNECFERNAEGMLKNMGKYTKKISSSLIIHNAEPTISYSHT